MLVSNVKGGSIQEQNAGPKNPLKDNNKIWVKTIPFETNKKMTVNQEKLPCKKLPTPILVNKVENYLTGFDQKDYLIDGFTMGFHLKSNQKVRQAVCQNLKSALALPGVTKEKIVKETEMGRLSGPFLGFTIKKLVISPIGLCAKKTDGWRMIHHLSFPEGMSVNDTIPHIEATVQYATVDQAVEKIVKLDQGCFLAKTDIKSAFRLIPLHPDDYPLVGFKWDGGYYFDKCLPMGASSACNIF